MTTPIESIVHVTVNTNQLSVEAANFGTPLIVDVIPTARFVPRTKTYASYSCLADMLTDGFTVHSPVYKMAVAILSQAPRVEEIKVGRLTRTYTQTVEVTVTSNTEGDRVGITIIGLDGTEHPSYYTVEAGKSLTQVAVSLETLIDAHSLAITTTPVVAKITCASTASGVQFWYYGNENCTIADITTNPGIGTDLTEIVAVDDEWYHVMSAIGSAPINDALATWVATTRKFAWLQTCDSDVPTSAITDIATELKDDSDIRCALIYHHAPDAPLSEFPCCAASGVELTRDPGAYTMKFKALSGVTPNTITSSQIAYLVSKRCNYYVTVAGVNMMAEGVCPYQKWVDVVRLADALKARIEENVFVALAANDKIPYDDSGIDVLRGAVWSAFSDIGEHGGLDLTSFLFTATTAASQATADRGNRIVRGIQFSGVLSGAIHEVYLTGDLV